VIVFSPGNMSSDDSHPRVRQGTKESVADRLHRMHSRQVLSERNLLRANLGDPVLLPIAQMLLENNWEYLYNCTCPAFPRLIIIQDDDRRLVMQTMVRGQTILIDPQLISSMIEVPVLLVSGVPFHASDETPSNDMISLGRDHREKTSPSPRSTSVLLLLFTRFLAKVVVTNLWPQAR
jgi:hypothetical protein